MDTMLARYLDGELTEHEARTFQTLLGANRALAAELRELEASLDLFTRARCRRTSRAFASRVMEALPPLASAPPASDHGRWRAWALAATVVLCLGLGWAAGHYAAPGAPPVAAVATADPAAAGDPALRWVRLVHVPHDPDVRQVAVAGDFNGWSSAATPMQRQGEVWVAWLALPADVYEYMFVENGGERWLTDPLAGQTRADGFGGENAILDLSL